MGKIAERMKTMIRNWLNVQPAPMTTVSITESLPFELKAIEGELWYRGDPYELDQFYKQINNDYLTGGKFWAAAVGNHTRKIHAGVPAMIVDTLSYIVKNDMDDVDFDGGTGEDQWKEICDSPNFSFTDVVGAGIVGALVSGDGAWKISVDREASSVPIVEFYPADRVQYICKHGIVTGIDFITDIPKDGKLLKLKEKYRVGSVAYELYDADRQIDLASTEETADLKPADFDGKYMMAVPLKFYDNSRFPTRGKSIFENKIDDFDAFDEIVSQWMDAFRQGRVQKYIPESLIPRDLFTGALNTSNPFDNEYVSVETVTTETGTSNDKIQVVQPEIRHDAFLAGYTQYLDLCLQGIVSPATLGIDLGKMASADAQREKKDVTGNTRNTITGKLEKALPLLASALLMTYDSMNKRVPGNYLPKVSFGEYGAPDFDSRVTTVGKAASDGTMSIKTQVEELWGSSKDDEWKASEVRRIEQMKGIAELEEPSIGM